MTDLEPKSDTQLCRLLHCAPGDVPARRARADARRGPRPTSAAELLRNLPARVASGCAPLDAALGGGVARGAVTEFVGRAGAGKTQCCNTFAAACAARGDDVVYVDTEQTFRPRRFWQIAEARGAPGPAETLLTRVSVLRRAEQTSRYLHTSLCPACRP